MVVESPQEMENGSLLIALLQSCDFVAKFWKKVVSKIVGVPHLRNWAIVPKFIVGYPHFFWEVFETANGNLSLVHTIENLNSPQIGYPTILKRLKVAQKQCKKKVGYPHFQDGVNGVIFVCIWPSNLATESTSLKTLWNDLNLIVKTTAISVSFPEGRYPTFTMWGKFVGSLKWCHLHVP